MTIWKPHVTVAAIAERDNTFLIVEELVDDQLSANPRKLRSPMVLSSIDDYLAGKRYSLDILEHIAADFGL
ncbi:MAG: hypothetical protein HKP12_02205 [Gammaproteobacteria bacterium]|nr:hypothetical protein [Gammaproteobacteria bacterium]NNJ95952.1 hypothetical protein [Gammaproteobacteria bacterium]